MYPKIVFMDLEGTLLKKDYALDNKKVAPSAWTVLAKRLGEDCYLEEEETKDKWLRGEYPGYVEWMRDTIQIHQKYGLSRALFLEVIQSGELMPGAEKAVSEFKRFGCITAIISGGFKASADIVQKKLKIDHAMCGCEYFFDEKTEKIEHYNLLPSDEDGKVDFMRLIAREHGIREKDCVFIGDGKNDVSLANEVGCSIAFNAQEELKDVSTIEITQPEGKEDFYQVAEELLKYSKGL